MTYARRAVAALALAGMLAGGLPAALAAGKPPKGKGKPPATAAAKPPAAVTADKHAAAVEHFEKGRKLGEVGRYAESIEEFEEAYLLEPLPEILLNIALSHRFLKHHEEAVSFYERYLRLKPDAPNRKEIEGLVREIERERVVARKAAEAEARKIADAASGMGPGGKAPAHVIVTSDPPGARVRAGTKELGTTPLKVELPPGSLLLRLELGGYEPKEVGVVAEPGRDALVAATLTPRVKPGSGAGPAAPAPGRMLVETNLPGASILVDGAVMAYAPMAGPLSLGAGRYRLSVAAPGFVPAAVDLVIESGGTATAKVTVTPENVEATSLFLKKREKFLASGLTIEGYWRKKKGTAELAVGGALFGFGTATLALSLVGAVGLLRGSGQTGEIAGSFLLAWLVGAPLVVVGGVFGITGAVKLGSLKKHRWIRGGVSPSGVMVSW